MAVKTKRISIGKWNFKLMHSRADDPTRPDMVIITTRQLRDPITTKRDKNAIAKPIESSRLHSYIVNHVRQTVEQKHLGYGMWKKDGQKISFAHVADANTLWAELEDLVFMFKLSDGAERHG